MKYKSLLPILLVTVLGLTSCDVNEHVHSWETLEVITPATCVSTGEAIVVCKECGSVEYTVTPIDPDGHSFSSLGRTEATCDTNIYYSYVCLYCGYTYNDEYPNTAYGHYYMPDYDENEHYEMCSRCGNKINIQPHNFVLKATEYQHFYECECGYVMGYENHDFIYNSSLINGKHVGTCSYCSYHLEVDYHVGISDIDEYTHSGTCVICGEEISGIHHADLRDDDSGYCYQCGTPLNSSGFTYSLNVDNTYTISDYNGDGGVVFIPRIYDSLPVVGTSDSALGNRNKFTHVFLPETLISLGARTFYYATNLEYIYLPESLVSIGDYCFYGCSALCCSIIFPDGLETMGKYAFANCSNLKIVEFGKNSLISEIPERAFAASGITFIDIPSSVTTIRNYAFYECRALKSIVLPESVSLISGAYAFTDAGVKTVYYMGDAVSWSKSPGYFLSPLNRSDIYFYSESNPSDEGNYWHYDEDGKTPIIWETSEETID